MDIRITPHELRGQVTPPPSKSLSHRALIAAYLAGSAGRIHGLAQSQDIEATHRCMEALLDLQGGFPVLDCGESGSTLRFLMPLALVVRGGARFIGHGRLMERPQEPYFEIFKKIGVHYERSGGELALMGRLTPGRYELPGNVSSQFVTGLLYALPLLEGDSEIVITTPLESRDYVTMTVDVLKRFGIFVKCLNYHRFYVPGGQRYIACDYSVEADWSQAGFWLAAAALGNEVEVTGLEHHSPQGDRAVEHRIKDITTGRCAEIDMSQIPDLLPPLAAAASVRDCVTRFVNAARLRMKESDRIASTAAMLRAFGAGADEGADLLEVHGTPNLRSCTVDGAGDHRIVMAAAIMASRADGPVTILGAQAVDKSYPGFFDDYMRLGGVCDVL